MSKGCEQILPIGLLKFAISVLKTDFSHWWSQTSPRYKPLIHNFYSDKESEQVLINLDDLMKCQQNNSHELKNCMKDLYHMIGTYTTYKEETDFKLNSRKNNSKNATAVAYYDVLLKDCENGIKDLIVTVSLIRPSWMSALILTKFIGKNEALKIYA